jgi:hypothetical protein
LWALEAERALGAAAAGAPRLATGAEPMLPRNCRRSLCRALTRAHASRTSSRAPRTRSAQHEDAIRTSVGCIQQ